MPAIFLFLLLPTDGSAPAADAHTIRAVWLVDLRPGRVR